MFSYKRSRRKLLLIVYVLLVSIGFLYFGEMEFTNFDSTYSIPPAYEIENDSYIIKEDVNEENILTKEEASEDYEEKQIGTVYIPRLDMEAPIIQSASVLDEDMQKVMKHTVGHEPQSYLPGEDREVILTGHREEQFSAFADVQKGDLVIVDILNNTFLYKVTETEIVLPDGEEALEYVRGEEDEDTLVMYTCYPFQPMTTVTNRFVVKAKRIEEYELKADELADYNINIDAEVDKKTNTDKEE